MLIILPSCELLVGVSSGRGKRKKRIAILCLQIFIYVYYNSIITFYQHVSSPSPTSSMGKAINNKNSPKPFCFPIFHSTCEKFHHLSVPQAHTVPQI